MRDTRSSDYQTDPRNGLARFGRWLADQPMQSWAFFAAGFVIARILF